VDAPPIFDAAEVVLDFMASPAKSAWGNRLFHSIATAWNDTLSPKTNEKRRHQVTFISFVHCAGAADPSTMEDHVSES
jgi:hypothetical protein